MNATPARNMPQQITVWPDESKPLASDDDGPFPTLTCYMPSEEFATGQVVLILPGGGYGSLSSAKEGHRPAQLLCAHGVGAAVLEYRHAPQRYPVPLLDAQRALRHLRAVGHRTLGKSPKTGALGFSAGGHLAGLLATSDPLPGAAVGDEIDELSCKPDFAALIYPVVSLSESFAHAGSRDNLLGSPGSGPTGAARGSATGAAAASANDAASGATDAASAAPTAAELSIEQRVTKATPPMFIAHSQDDGGVPVENAFALARALTEHNVAVELHVFATGGHGYGLATNHPWGRLMLDWVARQ
ncbi:MAG: alpha/beta hydrolase [Spirochaetales bacterium]